ncbi:hypothetical protein ACVBGC_34090 [Burkholderia stagnalis]
MFNPVPCARRRPFAQTLAVIAVLALVLLAGRMVCHIAAVCYPTGYVARVSRGEPMLATDAFHSVEQTAIAAHLSSRIKSTQVKPGEPDKRDDVPYRQAVDDRPVLEPEAAARASVRTVAPQPAAHPRMRVRARSGGGIDVGNFGASSTIAWIAIVTHRLRAPGRMPGLILYIAAATTLIALGQGARRIAASAIEAIDMHVDETDAGRRAVRAADVCPIHRYAAHRYADAVSRAVRRCVGANGRDPHAPGGQLTAAARSNGWTVRPSRRLDRSTFVRRSFAT